MNFNVHMNMNTMNQRKGAPLMNWLGIPRHDHDISHDEIKDLIGLSSTGHNNVVIASRDSTKRTWVVPDCNIF